MNISAINSTPIKPQVAFKQMDIDHEKLHTMATELDGQKVDAKDIKRPIAIVASLAALAGIAYGGGKKIATGASVIYEKVASLAKNSADDAAEAAKNANLGVVIENGLKKASSFANNGISKLRTVDPKEVTVLTKKDFIRNKTADVLEKGLNLAKNTYKKLAYSGISKDVVGADRAQKAFENVAGLVGLATVVPEIATRDANEDGVKDIMQKSQNAYTATAEKVTSYSQDLNAVQEMIQMLT